MRPTIDDAKAFQRKIRLTSRHIAWFDCEGFILAHTDEERASPSELSACPLYKYLSEVVCETMPVSMPGWYFWDGDEIFLRIDSELEAKLAVPDLGEVSSQPDPGVPDTGAQRTGEGA